MQGDGRIAIYPNPVSDRLTIQCGKGFTTGALITLYDVTGRVLYTALVKEAVHTINLHEAAPGVYFIQVKQGEDKENNEKLDRYPYPVRVPRAVQSPVLLQSRMGPFYEYAVFAVLVRTNF